MNAVEIHNAILSALEAEDTSDDTYILPGNHKYYRIAYDESDWENGIETRLAHIGLVPKHDHTKIHVKTILGHEKNFTISHSGDVSANASSVFDDVSEFIKSYSK